MRREKNCLGGLQTTKAQTSLRIRTDLEITQRHQTRPSKMTPVLTTAIIMQQNVLDDFSVVVTVCRGPCELSIYSTHGTHNVL